MVKKILFITLLLLSVSFPQKTSNENNNLKFKQAVNLFEALEYKRALDLFNSILEETNNSKTTLAKLFKAKTLIKLEQFEEAYDVLDDFIAEYPESKYLNEARSGLIKIFYLQKNYLNVLKECVKIIADSSEQFYTGYAKNIAAQVGSNYLNSFQLNQIINDVKKDELKSFLLLMLTKVYLKEGNISESKKIIERIIRDYPSSEESEEAKIINENLNSLQTENSSNSIIGVLLPLNGENVTGDESAIAKEILEGIKFAVSEFNKDREKKIGLLILNTGMDAEKINQIKKEVEYIPQLKAIIGPIYSEEVRQVLNVFEDSNIPIISPTATDNDLTRLSENFFQANPSLDNRGKIMAQYIFFVENIRKIAVLNSIDGYSPILSGSFKTEFKRLGGEIIVSETYKSNSFDISTQVKNISNYKNDFEAIYIPLADKIDATVILSELAIDGVYTSIYGNQDWFLSTGFDASPELGNKITFTSDYYFDFNNPDFQDFSKSFLSQTKKDMNRNICYGYDTANYLLNLLRGTFISREAIITKMESGFTSVGYHNNISFDENRINRYLNILKYNNGLFELIDKFKTNN